ncbi:hypothetical protein [Arthrobacter antibioticus]|uniref:hypothetical protein n=1 Tax=Arthrobacter sp. H35-MC1 TaxID=3046203 RepID=UPI0024B8C47F|nr:hypothetical protein [Arthrobacter sp. H35-MC1]MDJ0316947.1 hypothetical protein [Arthrobacter sp. H35-MC1]
MAPIRTHLHSSTFWSARRPGFPLTQGHYVLRLNDPSIEFGTESAADLLRCYAHLRRALCEIAGATAAQLYIALNWQPVGDAVGEPLAETSTPTLHLFFSLPEGTTAASALRLPAHQRLRVGETRTLDEALRSWQEGTSSSQGPGPDSDSASAPSAESSGQELPTDLGPTGEHAGWADRPFCIEPVRALPGTPFQGGHWTAQPRTALATLDPMDPMALLELANTLESLVSQARPAYAGVTVWVNDQWSSQAPLTFHIFGRRHGDGLAQVAGFVTGGGLDSPVTEPLQGKTRHTSHIVKR